MEQDGGIAGVGGNGGVALPLAEIPLQIDVSAVAAPKRARLLAEALSGTPATDHERRAALLAALALAQSLADPDLAPESLAAARREAHRAGTDIATVHTLIAEYAMDLSPETLDRRLEITALVMDLLARPTCATLRSGLLPMAHFMYVGTLMESGDTPAVDAALSAELHLTDLIASVLDTRFSTWFRSARAIMDGNLTLAEQLAQHGHRIAVARGDVDAETVLVGQTAVIRWMQGRISEMEPSFLEARRTDPTEPLWSAVVAWIWAHQGRVEAARGLIGSLPDLTESPQNRNWLAATAILADVAADIGSASLVESLRVALTPFADRVVTAGLGIVPWGTVARPLALIARRQGRISDAVAHYRSAISLCSRIGAQAWLARAQAECALLELERGEVALARELAAESAAAAHHLGLASVVQQAQHLLAATEPPARRGGTPVSAAARIRYSAVTGVDPRSSPVPSIIPPTADAGTPSVPQSAPPDLPRITVLGHFSVTRSDGSPATWRSRRARTLLQVLVAQRGERISREAVMDLLWPHADPHLLRNRLSVALTAVRKALDPHRHRASDHFVATDNGSLRLRTEHLSVDLEDFLLLIDAAQAGDHREPDHQDLLRAALAEYGGTAFADEPFAAWAEPLRNHTQLAFQTAAHALAEVAEMTGDLLKGAELFRRILRADPYDERAHDGLIRVLTALGGTSYVAAAREERDRRRAELGPLR